MSNIVCFGEVLWDVFSTYKKIGGAPLNVALRLNSFNDNVTMISCVGNDANGKALLVYAEKEGLDKIKPAEGSLAIEPVKPIVKNNAIEPLELEIKVVPEKLDEEVEMPKQITPAPYDPILDLRDYKYPTLDLLENHGSEKIVQDNNELENNKNQIITGPNASGKTTILKSMSEEDINTIMPT